MHLSSKCLGFLQHKTCHNFVEFRTGTTTKTSPQRGGDSNGRLGRRRESDTETSSLPSSFRPKSFRSRRRKRGRGPRRCVSSSSASYLPSFYLTPLLLFPPQEGEIPFKNSCRITEGKGEKNTDGRETRGLSCTTFSHSGIHSNFTVFFFSDPKASCPTYCTRLFLDPDLLSFFCPQGNKGADGERRKESKSVKKIRTLLFALLLL